MKVEFSRKFEKQYNGCKDKRLKQKVAVVVNEAIQANDLKAIKQLKKLKGSRDFYRIRVGDYRIGVVCIQNTLLFASLDHRSEIYKYFP